MNSHCICGHRDLNSRFTLNKVPGCGLTSHDIYAWKASVLTKLDDDRNSLFKKINRY